jgi:hypothetical protein
VQKFPGNPEVLGLKGRYGAMKLVESSDSSYTINKASGPFDKIHICLQKNGFFDIDTIMFVVIHELTHVYRTELDLFDEHPPEFWRDNKFLLIQAENAGVMKNIDYSRSPVSYCAKEIRSNPYFINLM